MGASLRLAAPLPYPFGHRRRNQTPLHEYRCDECRSTFEHFHRSQDDTAVPSCPYCGCTRVVKQASAAQVQFKGPGFYETDYKGKP